MHKLLGDRALLPTGISVCLCVGSLFSQTVSSAQIKQDRACVDAARKALGHDAVVLKCGHLTDTKSLETVAAVRLRPSLDEGNWFAVSELVVLRQNGSEWTKEFSADRKWMRNPVGFIGIDFIDDSDPFIGYRASFSDRAHGFCIAASYLAPDGESEGIATEICWNPAVGRFQEFSYNQDPEGFKPEVVNPPHIRQKSSQ